MEEYVFKLLKYIHFIFTSVYCIHILCMNICQLMRFECFSLNSAVVIKKHVARTSFVVWDP